MIEREVKCWFRAVCGTYPSLVLDDGSPLSRWRLIRIAAVSFFSDPMTALGQICAFNSNLLIAFATSAEGLEWARSNHLVIVRFGLLWAARMSRVVRIGRDGSENRYVRFKLADGHSVKRRLGTTAA